MIQQQTILKVTDNSGAKKVKCIKVFGGFKRKVARAGDVICISVKELRNKYKINSKVKSGEVLYCLILRTKTPLKRKDGTYMFFYNNCVCLLTKNKKPLATRVFGPISKQLRQKKLMKLASVSAGFI